VLKNILQHMPIGVLAFADPAALFFIDSMKYKYELWSIFFLTVMFIGEKKHSDGRSDDFNNLSRWTRNVSVCVVRECKNIDFVLVFDSDFRQFTIADRAEGD
jgi:hypothetical protein